MSDRGESPTPDPALLAAAIGNLTQAPSAPQAPIWPDYSESVRVDPAALERELQSEVVTCTRLSWDAQQLAAAVWPDHPKHVQLEELIKRANLHRQAAYDR